MTRYVIAEDCAIDMDWEPEVTLPDMRPGDSVRVTMTADGSFDVVPLMRIGAYALPTNPNRQQPMWTDALEQGNG